MIPRGGVGARRQGRQRRSTPDGLLAEAEVVIEPVTEHQARLARQVYADFGRGSGRRAGLNFGDCLCYALALDTREPLLWKGDDFGHTGIASALDR
jgi:ribonuclease VapC